MKKLVALMMALLMVLSLTSAIAEDPSAGKTKVIFWHSRGDGSSYAVTKEAVDTFNATIGAEKNIWVEEVYIGGYGTLQTKTQMAAQSGEQPTVAVTSGVRNAILMDDGLTVDLAPYIAASNWDTSRFFDGIFYTAGNEDGHVYSLPYIRSTPLFFYNKTMADAKNLTAPRTIAEMEEFAKALHTVDANGEVLTYGFELTNDICYLQGSLLYQLGSSLGGGGEAACLTDGAMAKVLGDWTRWMDEGWCRVPTKEALGCTERLAQGMLGCFVGSCATLGNLVPACEEMNIELGVAYFPVYDAEKPACAIGGGCIVLLDNNTDEVKQAGWEFMMYLLSDERIIAETCASGYLPSTKTVVDSPVMQAYWAENPGFKLAYDQLAWGTTEESPFWVDLTEYKTNVQNIVGELVTERNMTVEEAIQKMLNDNAHIL